MTLGTVALVAVASDITVSAITSVVVFCLGTKKKSPKRRWYKWL